MLKKLAFMVPIAVWTFAAGVTSADDTDLYLDPDPPNASAPLVMFSIDYRPNVLGSPICTAEDPACREFLVEPGYLPKKDEGDSYSFFDLIRGSLNAVLNEVGGIRIGLMLNHNDQEGKSCTGPDAENCTNGGYIAMGFRDLSSPTDADFQACAPFKGSEGNLTRVEAFVGDTFGNCDPARGYLLRKMWAMPMNEVNGTGSIAHFYQGKELFLELYRYLTGGQILNGHNGWSSYDRSNAFDLTPPPSYFDFLEDTVKPFPPFPPGGAHPNDWNLQNDPMHSDYEFRLDGGEYARDPVTGFGVLDPSATLPNPAPRIAWDDTTQSDVVPGITAVEDSNHENYISPLDPETDVCTKLYSVNMMFQVSQQDDDSDAVLAEEGIVRTRKGGQPITSQFDDVIAYMNNNDVAKSVPGDQFLTSYFLGDERFYENRTMEQYAAAGGTPAPLPLSESPEELIAVLTRVLSEILSVSTTFVAASIPVNSFNRAEVLDQVVLALFQPNEQAGNPYWWGNVKKLRLEGLQSSGVPKLVDALGQPAVAVDGRISPSALTYWTNNTYPDVIDADPDQEEISGYDGRSVRRGGAGHKTPGFPNDPLLSSGPKSSNAPSPARRILYEDGLSLAPLDVETLPSAVVSNTKAAFGKLRAAAGQPGLTDEQTLNLIKYARGMDVFDDRPEGDPNSVDEEAQPWMFGSALHSRPLLINYGTSGGHESPENPLIYIAVGTNDGLFRFIRNTTPDVAGGQAGYGHGREAWAFLPRSTMPAVEQIVRQRPGMSDLSVVGPAWNNYPRPPYGVDGSPVAYIDDKNGDGNIDGEDKVYVFFGLRRGGSNYYGLDVTNPEDPKLMWVIEGGSGDFANLALSFSTPTIGRVYDKQGAVVPALVFGGGYDPAYDGWGTPAAPSGNSIYVVNALDGKVIHEFNRDSNADFLDSVASPVAAVDLQGADGFLDRGYVGDMGGNVWRINIPNSPEAAKNDANWTMRLIAQVGLRGGFADRRFFHRPDVVQYNDENAAFDAVVIGSGNRAEPKDSSANSAETNFMYMFKDREVSELEPPPSEDLATIKHDSTGLQDITECTIGGSPACTDSNLTLGWKLGLTAYNEKSLSTPLTLGGVVFFTSFIPPGAQTAQTDTVVCTPPEGSGRLYRVALATGNPLTNRDRPIDEQEPGSPDERWDVLDSSGIPAEVVAIPPNRILRPDLRVEPVPVTTRWRTFWHLTEEPRN